MPFRFTLSLISSSNSCKLRFNVDAAVGQRPNQTTEESPGPKTFGPQTKDKLDGTLIDTHQDDFEESADQNEDFDEDTRWQSNSSAARDKQSLKVFRRVHLIQTPDISERSYVFLDIAIGGTKAGKIIIELVSLNNPN